MKYRTLVLVAALLALGACDSKEKKAEKPAELTDIKSPTVRIQKLWGASVGGGGKKLRLGLGLASDGDHLFAAGRDGDVASFDLKSGKQLWRAETKLVLSGGTGVGSGVVAVGSADGQVVAIGAGRGRKRGHHSHRRWHAPRVVTGRWHRTLERGTADSASHPAWHGRTRR